MVYITLIICGLVDLMGPKTKYGHGQEQRYLGIISTGIEVNRTMGQRTVYCLLEAEDYGMTYLVIDITQ